MRGRRDARPVVAARSAAGAGAGPTADLLVCFPARARLALLPKPICSASPSRASTSSDPGAAHRRRHSMSGVPRPTSLFKTEPGAPRRTAVDNEPTSPKVTCVGQIKARSGSAAAAGGKKGRRRRTRPGWLEAFGVKKEATLNFFQSFRGLGWLNLGCFAPLPCQVEDDESSDDDGGGEGEDGDQPANIVVVDEERDSTLALSKWFMTLEAKKDGTGVHDGEPLPAPPANALLLMRCRSAPARGAALLAAAAAAAAAAEAKEEEKEKEQRLLVMSYAPDFLKLSTDIAKETWLVGGDGGDDLLIRCRSWKR